MSGPPSSSASRPDLSVVLVVGDHRSSAGHALRSLLQQDAVDRMEILLVDLGRDPVRRPVEGADHPAARHERLPPETTFGPARRHAVQRARAPVVAFLEEHARACPGWAAALLRAHGSGWAAVGPVVESANPGVGRSDLVGLITYGYFRPLPAEDRPERRPEGRPGTGPGDHPTAHPAAQPTDLLPGHNSSFDRSVLLSYRAELDHLLANDNLLFARLLRDGHRLARAPGARIRHFDEASTRDCMAGYFHHHRIYGHGRAQMFGWSRARRLAYVVLAPAMPLYFFWKFGRHLRRHPPHHPSSPGRLLARHAAAAYLCQLAGACGQALGLLVGPGEAERHFTRCELHGDRPGSENP